MYFQKNTKKSLKQHFKNQFDLISFIAKSVRKANLLQVSSSLSYTTLIAIVPVIAVALAIFSAFPAFDAIKQDLQDFVLQNFVPSATDTVYQYVTSFVEATGKLTIWGVVGIAVTSILLLSTIENAFNNVFNVEKHRPMVSKILLYWTVLTLGPLLLGASFSLSSSFIKNHNYDYSYFSRMLPYCLMWLAVFILYVFVPNCKVPLKPALLGSFISSILFMILKSGFGAYVKAVTTYQTLYGALAVLPFFLVWMYVSWAVILLGAAITVAISEYSRED